MPLSHQSPWLSAVFHRLARWLDRRTALRLPLLLLGILLASGRRTATSWFRAAGIADDFRAAYHTIFAVGRRTEQLPIDAWLVARPCLVRHRRIVLAIDDTPTPRYGRQVQGAGLHHNPTPGPAGEKYVYGHLWVLLTGLAKHPTWGTLALPLLASLYVRRKDLPKLQLVYAWEFRTKLELAAAQLRWLKPWVEQQADERWVAVDGGYAKKPFLRAARRDGYIVVSRLRKDAALFSVPSTVRRPRQRGPLPTYGKQRLSLAKRAGHQRGWQQIECVQYGERVSKTYKTFLATWRPAGGLIRVVLVQEEANWIPFFCTDPAASVADILEAAADRGAIEQTNKDVKEVWGAGQQQLRNVHANVGAFNLNAWMHTVVEVWGWERSAEELVDRSRSPWDDPKRRPGMVQSRVTLGPDGSSRKLLGTIRLLPKPAAQGVTLLPSGLNQADVLRMRTSERHCNGRCCVRKSKPFCPDRPTCRDSANWPKNCSASPLEGDRFAESTVKGVIGGV